MLRKTIPLFALALGALAATGSAHARDVDLQWSVTIGSPRVGVVVGAPVYAPPVYAPPVYAPPVYAPRVHAPRVITQPVVVLPQRGVYGTYGAYGVAHGRGWKDADRDGVPNRYDRRDRNPYRR